MKKIYLAAAGILMAALVAAAAGPVTEANAADTSNDTAKEEVGTPKYVRLLTSDSQKGLSKEDQKKKNRRRVKVKWTEVKGATKYKIYYSYKKDGKYKKATKKKYIKGEAAGSTRSYVIGLPKDKKVYIRVRAFKGSKYGKASTPVSVKAGSEKNASKIRITQSKKTVYTNQTMKFQGTADKGVSKKLRWYSSKPSVAEIDEKSGLITPVKPGKTTIIAVAHNGLKKKIPVTVKNPAEDQMYQAPRLIYVASRPQKETSKELYNVIQWASKADYTYEVLRKEDSGSYTAIARKKASDTKTSYTDKTAKTGRTYTYTVRRYKKKSGGETLGAYDKEGIKTIGTVKNLKVDDTNLHAVITWDKVDGAQEYSVQRKINFSGSYRNIAAVTDTSCEDIYHDTLTKSDEKQYLIAEYYVDPSSNPFVYQVRAQKKVTGADGKEKTSYSFYYPDGEFKIESPPIIDFSKNGKSGTLRWGRVFRCSYYTVFKGHPSGGKMVWTKIADVKRQSGTAQSATVPYDEENPYYTVVAYADKNGTKIHSGHDSGFYVNGRDYGNKKVLYLGNSITYGSPYKGDATRHIFSYPYRIAQLTGVKYFNPSIPGSTWSYYEGQKTSYHRYRIVTDVALAIKENRDTGNYIDLHIDQSKREPYSAYDVVVMAAGTNDYGDSDPYTNITDDLENTEYTNMTGALNTIMSYIEEGSQERIDDGKEPIRVVFVDFFYSDRLYSYGERTNRFVTENSAGYTLTDYQNQYNRIISRYENLYGEGGSKENLLSIYHFKTNNYKLVTEENCPYRESDNLHMTRYTYTQIGNTLADYMIRNGILD